MSATLTHPSTCRPQQRTSQLVCRAQHGAADQRASQCIACTRRNALGTALLLPAAVLAARPVAAEEASAGALEVQPAAPPPALDVASWPLWVDRYFSFSYPPGFKEADVSYAAPPKRVGVDQVSENPLKAEVRDGAQRRRINVVSRQATSYKRTLFQVTDISQLGDPRQVAKFLVPPGAVVASASVTAVPQPARDTGTVLGLIERDPVSYYNYELVLPDEEQTHVRLAAAAQLGRLYVLAASAPGSEWEAAAPALREAAASFRLRYKS